MSEFFREERSLSAIIEHLIAQQTDMLPNFDGEYRIFSSPYAREDIFDACKSTADYAYDNDVAAVAFVDRAARPMWVGFKQYWNMVYGDQEASPDVFFVNPDGFEDFNPRLSAKRRATEKVKTEHPKLAEHRDNTVLLADACVHSGRTMRSIKHVLELAGFDDIRLSAVDTSELRCEPETIDHAAATVTTLGCYPFGNSPLITTNGSKLVSERDGRLMQRERRVAFRTRREIRQIIRDGVRGEEVLDAGRAMVVGDAAFRLTLTDGDTPLIIAREPNS